MFTSRFTTRRLAHFCRRVGVSLEAGIDVRKVFDREVQRAAWRERTGLARVQQAIASGHTIDQAIAQADGLFPPMVQGMVRVGEEAGRIDEAFLKLAEHYDRQLALRRTFLAGILWPVIQLVVALLVIGLVIWVLGVIGQQPGGETVDILGLGLVGNRGLAIYVASLACIAAAGFALYRAATLGLAWSRPLQRVVMAVPVLGNSLKTLALSRLSWTLAVTHDTGMDTIRAVSLAVANAQNVLFTAGLEQILTVVRRGGTISEGMKAAGGYPQEFVNALEVGEDTGQISESMAHLSKLYEERAKAALAALTVLAGFLVWGLVAAFIIVIIFRFAMFHIGMINDLAKP